MRCADTVLTREEQMKADAADLKLSEKTVKALPKPDAGFEVTYFAGHILQGFTAPAGFGVRVTAAGARSFVLDYRAGRKQRRYTLGAYPDWTVIKALKHAKALRQEVDLGRDPQDDKEAARAPVGKTIGDVLDDYIKERAEGRL